MVLFYFHAHTAAPLFLIASLKRNIYNVDEKNRAQEAERLRYEKGIQNDETVGVSRVVYKGFRCNKISRRCNYLVSINRHAIKVFETLVTR